MLQVLSFKEVLEAHFAAEEALIPTLREKFTLEEVAAGVRDDNRERPWYFMPQMLHPMTMDGLLKLVQLIHLCSSYNVISERKQFLIDRDIPWLIRKTIAIPRIEKYEETIASLLAKI